MKREINMIFSEYKKVTPSNKKNGENKREEKSEINTDPFGSWTGVPTDNAYDKPVQDADDL